MDCGWICHSLRGYAEPSHGYGFRRRANYHGGRSDRSGLPSTVFCKPGLAPDRFWAATGLTFINLALVWWVWLSYRPAYAEIIASFDRLAKDSTVLVADSYPPGKPGGGLGDYPFYHAPTLAVAYANALVPSLFTYPGDRPVTLRPAYRQFVQPGLLAPKFAALPDIASGADKDAPEYLRSWPQKYDYIYVLGPRAPNPMPLLLHELERRVRLCALSRSTNLQRGLEHRWSGSYRRRAKTTAYLSE